MFSRFSPFLRILFFSLLFGGASGVIASALTQNYLADYALSLTDFSAPSRLSAERPRRLPNRYEDALSLVRERAIPAAVQLYTAPPPASGFYDLQESEGSGVIITSDGWILTTVPLSPDQLSSARLVVGRQAYAIQKAVQDPASPALFLKVDAANLPVIAFGDAADVALGDTLFVAASRLSFTPTFLAGWKRVPVPAPAAETARKRFLLNDNFAVADAGAGVTNAAGELVGLLVSEGQVGTRTVLPLSSLPAAMQSLLKTGSISRPVLGISAIDLANEIASKEAARGLERGALVQSVLSKSPAAAAGIKAGDVILEINGEPIDSVLFLDDFLFAYQPGDKLSCLFNRAGEEMTVQVVLGSR